MSDIVKTKGTPDDYEDIIDFGDMVFGVNFRELLPKFYSDRPEIAACHHLVKENGRIRAEVGSFPVEMEAGGETLRVRGIGTVSVHRCDRGKGYMKELMKSALEEAEQDGTDMMVLSGRRQRYEYFGFTKGMADIRLGFNRNVRRYLKTITTKGIDIVPLSDNREYLCDCGRLLEEQPVHAVRDLKDFTDIVRSWDSEGSVILLHGEFLGYCSVSWKNRLVQEMYLKDSSFAANVVMKLCEEFEEPFEIGLFPYQGEMLHILNLICESMSLEENIMMNVLHYPAVIRAYLTMKGMTETLADGSLVFEDKERGRYEIRVQGGKVTVEETTLPAHVSLSHQRTMSYLFSSLGQFGIEKRTPEEQSWLPIPLYYPSCDNA